MKNSSLFPHWGSLPSSSSVHSAREGKKRFQNKSLNACVLFQPTYRKLLPLYYPRSGAEEKASLPLIPADIGNSEGEPVVPERQIRIAEKPGVLEGKSFSDKVPPFFFFFFLHSYLNI